MGRVRKNKIAPDFVIKNMLELYDERPNRQVLAGKCGISAGTLNIYMPQPHNIPQGTYNKIAAVMGWQKWEKP